jgi:hypothetical protein
MNKRERELLAEIDELRERLSATTTMYKAEIAERWRKFREVRELTKEVSGLREVLEEAYSDAYPDRTEEDLEEHIKRKIKKHDARTEDHSNPDGVPRGVRGST